MLLLRQPAAGASASLQNHWSHLPVESCLGVVTLTGRVRALAGL